MLKARRAGLCLLAKLMGKVALRYHLIGIAGTGMGSAAGLLRAAGHEVRGSDNNIYPPMSTQLLRLGIPVATPFSAQNLAWNPDRVVVGNACRKDHVEVLAAQSQNLPLWSLPQVLSEEFLAGETHPVVVAGTHGKTTTAALCSQIFLEAGLDPSIFVGGVPTFLEQSFRLGRGKYFVLEGDEYDTAFFDKGPKFLHYRPRTAIVTAVEYDHADIYASLDAVVASFRRFVSLLPSDGLLILGTATKETIDLADHTRARVETYGPEGSWRLGQVDWQPHGWVRFEVLHQGASVGRFDAAVIGEHNLWNAVAAVAVAAGLGISAENIGKGLRAFGGVRRRQEVRGVAHGVTVIDDFAHHPTAIGETLRAIRRRYGSRARLIALYDPRSATSRRNVLHAQTAQALAAADEVAIGPVIGADSIPPAERLNPADLAADVRKHHVPARAFDSVGAIVEHVVPRVRSGDVVTILSSGAFGGLCEKLLCELGDAVTPAEGEDAKSIGNLLDRVGLARCAFEQHLGSFLVIRHQQEIAGCVGLELHDDVALLRSLAVTPTRRGEGLGWTLAESALGLARARGCRKVFLFTLTAADFFAEKLGFQLISPDVVDSRLQLSPEYRDCCGNGAACMVLELG